MTYLTCANNQWSADELHRCIDMVVQQYQTEGLEDLINHERIRKLVLGELLANAWPAGDA
jgi:hypothetical protein